VLSGSYKRVEGRMWGRKQAVANESERGAKVKEGRRREGVKRKEEGCNSSKRRVVDKCRRQSHMTKACVYLCIGA
jgi:hypothetical protein